MKNHNRGSVTLIPLIIAVLIIAGLGYYIYSRNQNLLQASNNTSVNTQTNVKGNTRQDYTPSSNQTAGWTTYTSKYGFSFDYPSDILVAPIESTESAGIVIRLPYQSSPFDSKGNMDAENSSIKIGQTVKLGLAIYIDKQNNPAKGYKTQLQSYAKNPQYKQTIVGGKIGYSPSDTQEYNAEPNVQLISINNDYIITYIGMMVGRKVNGGVAVNYDWSPVLDQSNIQLFNKILTTVTFQK
jgi:Tfp pilus assembly protein PilE